MKRLRGLCALLCVLCALPSYMQAVSYGADGMITNVPDNFQFPAADGDNIIFPCGVIKNGFSLEDATTTCSFQSLFGVSGDVDLHGGTLILHSDFYYDNRPSTFRAGRIVGNGYTLSLSPRTSLLNQATDEVTVYGTELVLSADVILHGTWRFAGAATIINGQGYTITLSDDATLIIDQGSGLLLENVNLVGLSEGKLYCTTDEVQLTLRNTTFVLSNDYSFTTGSLKIIENCHLQGPYTFDYTSIVNSTVASQATLYVDAGTTFKYNPVSEEQTLLVFEDATSCIYLSGGRLHAGLGGMLLKHGSMQVEGLSYLRSDSSVQVEYIPYTILRPGMLGHMFDNDLTYTLTLEKFNITNNGIILGNGQSADDFTCYMSKGATLYVEQDTVLSYSNANPYLIKSHDGHALLKIGTGSSLNVYTPLATTEVFITFEKNAYLGKCDTVDISAPITFKNVFLRKRLPS